MIHTNNYSTGGKSLPKRAYRGIWMFRFLREQFGIYPVRRLNAAGYDAYHDGRFIYIMKMVYKNEQDELLERHEMAKYLLAAGEKFIPVFLPALDGSYVKQAKDNYYLVLKLEQWDTAPPSYIGRDLAKFHYFGFNLEGNLKYLNRLGKWKALWEKRIARLQELWEKTVMSRPDNDFERLFVESFPYYAGITENAIQYFIDTTIDEYPGAYDRATICHDRFTETTWNGPVVWKSF